MKKIFLTALAVALMCAWTPSADAACTGSSPNWTAGVWGDVATCHTNASNGDTITVTGGSATVTTTTSITKYVTLICGGTCTLTDNVTNLANVLEITESTAGSTRLEGFDFVAGTGWHVQPNGVVKISATTNGLPVLITGNSYAGGGAGDFFIVNTNRGVIWENSMTGVPQGGNCNNTVSFLRHKPGAADSDSWTSVSTFGSADTNGDLHLYIENNNLDDLGEGIDIDDNGRAVIRFNTLTNTQLIAHGADTSNVGSRYMEIYGNTIAWDSSDKCGTDIPSNVNTFIAFRGGTSLIFNNSIADMTSTAWGNKTELQFWVEYLRRNQGNYACWTGGYPGPYQSGWGYISGGTQAGTTGLFFDREPFLVFANTGAGNYASPSVQDYSPNDCGGGAHTVADYIQANREYYLANGSFDGTTGIGSGARTSRPATCTTGVFYFSTDQGGNWDTTGGDSTDGAVDKCTATNTWTNDFYIPKTYPHSLTQAASTAKPAFYYQQLSQ